MPKRKREEPEIESEGETDIIVWATDEEVLADIADEIESEECICVDEEITAIREALTEIKLMLLAILNNKQITNC